MSSDLDESRRFAPERLLAKLGRAVGDPERAVDTLLVGSVGERFEGGHVLGRPGSAHELRAEALG